MPCLLCARECQWWGPWLKHETVKRMPGLAHSALEMLWFGRRRVGTKTKGVTHHVRVMMQELVMRSRAHGQVLVC